MLESASRTPSTSSPFASLLDREQGQPLVGPGGDDDHVRRGALDDELLAPGQPEAVAGPLGPHRDRLGPVLGRPRRRRAPRPSRRRGCRGTSARACGVPFSASTTATAVIRKGDGVRLRPISSSTIPASTWPSPRPPSASSDQDAGEAQLGDLLPQRMAEAVAAAAVAIFAKLVGDRAFVRHQLARRVAEHDLVFGEVERHSSSPCSPAKAGVQHCPRWVPAFAGTTV